MKKVLFVATVVKAHIMVFHIPFLKWFKENGYETYVCARNDYENNEDCVIPYCDYYIDLPFERSPLKLKNFITYKQLKEIINSNEFDTIHCHTPMGGVLTRLAAQKARKNGTRVFYTAHGFHFYKGAPFRNWLIYYPIERMLARYTDVLITINKEDNERAKKYFKAGRIEYVPGVGVDIKKFRDCSVNKILKRREIGVPEDAFVLLSVGELNKNKNHEVVIKAIARLNNPKVHYVICGQGSLENYLRELVKQFSLENQVHILGFRADIDEISKVANIFTFLSYREGLSVALMEAMASGLPVICSDIRGNSDLIEKGKGGYLFNPNDVDGINKALNELMADKNKCSKFGLYNSTKILGFTKEKVIKKITAIYREV